MAENTSATVDYCRRWFGERLESLKSYWLRCILPSLNLLTRHQKNESLIEMKKILLSICALVVTVVFVAISIDCGIPLLYYAFGDKSKEPYGYVDTDGHMTLNLRHLGLCSVGDRFSDGYCLVSKLTSDGTHQKYSFIDRQGKFLSGNCDFSNARNFSDGFAAVQLDGNSSHTVPFFGKVYEWNFVDKAGRVLLRTNDLPIETLPFACGVAGVRRSSDYRWQYINKTGDLAFSGAFDDATPFSEDIASVRLNNRWGLINKAGKFLLEPTYEPQQSGSDFENPIRPFHEGLAAAVTNKGTRVDYLNTTGQVAFSLEKSYKDKHFLKFKSPGNGSKSFIRIEDGLFHRGFFDCSIANEDLSEGLVVFQRDGKFGFMDTSKSVVVRPTFDYCWPFADGRALVYLETMFGGRFGYIDHSGKIVIPCIYAKAFSFSDGLAVVSDDIKSSQYKYITKHGKVAIARSLPYATSFHDGLARVGRWNVNCDSF